MIALVSVHVPCHLKVTWILMSKYLLYKDRYKLIKEI